MDTIEILSIDEFSQWPANKKMDYEQLQIVTQRILEKKVDLTNGFGSDLLNVVLVYARFNTEEAKQMCWDVCSISPKFDEKEFQKKWDFATKDNKLLSNKKLWLLCKYHNIDTTVKDEGPLNTADQIVAYLRPGVDPNFVLENGFYPYVDKGQSGYYFRTGEKTFAAVSNFIIEPLMHVYSKEDNKRIIAIDNGYKRAVLDLPSKSLISLDQFRSAVFDEGAYTFWGTIQHLFRILNTINDNFPVCYELKTLGWQPEGFFAWSNYVYIPAEKKLEEFSSLGIAEVGEFKYFSPSASDINSSTRKENDDYENDRYLTYIKSDVTLEQWADLFNKVYPDQGLYGIAFVFIGMFKDLVYKIDNNCPHLSAYGEKGSGKSKFAESISSVFLNDLQPFNLNHGTDFAFFTRLARFRNCVTWFDEFDDAAIKEDRFQSIKGAYDGAGRERGKGGNKNKTEVAKVNSALLLTGQYLSTRDDNAALSRCIILSFSPNNDRSKESITNYENLKNLEKKGLTGLLTEILQHRPVVEKEYSKTFPETFSELRQLVTDAGGQYKERVLRNYTAVVNLYRYFCQHFKFPFTYEQVKQTCVKDIIKLSTLISESDSLADFWNTVEFLLETGEIYEGFHFKISEHMALTVKRESKEENIKFSKPTKLLFIRLTTIHKLYLEAHRKQTGKNGINLQSLELYIGSAKGYIGKSSSQRFTSRDGNAAVTSCYVFDYNLLAIPLERVAEPTKEQTPTTIEGYLIGDVEYVEIGGKPLLKARIMKSETYKLDEKIVKREIVTTIFSSNLQEATKFETRQQLTIKGLLREENYTDKDGQKRTKRSMQADSIELTTEQLSAWQPAKDVPPL